MRISYTFHGKTLVAVFDKYIVIGRLGKYGVEPDLNLGFDLKVSRPHARIWAEGEKYWIEDLTSYRGTKVNGEEIKGKGKRQLHSGDTIAIGDTSLRVEEYSPRGAPDRRLGGDRRLPSPLPKSEPPPAAPEEFPEFAVDEENELDATRPAFISANVKSSEALRMALLYELPLEFASETNREALLQLIPKRLLEAIPGAEQAALLLGDKLLLVACYPHSFGPSLTFAQRAAERRQAFIWPPVRKQPEANADGSPIETRSLGRVQSAVYVPLLWKDQVLGVICLENCKTERAFNPKDLRFLLAVAHHGAMVLGSLQMQDDLRQNAQVLERLLTNFSPRIREKLLHEARQGRFRPGGEKSDVAILCSDIRGFTALSAGMDVDDVVKMLNAYFAVLTECVFQYEGTVDKFIGDAMLAVFGSPDPVADYEEKAVRAALEMQTRVAELNHRRAAQGYVTCEIGIGVHCGEVLHGFIGTAERMEFTIIGDAVNRVSRFCDAARNGEVLLSQELRARIWHRFALEDAPFEDKHGVSFIAYRAQNQRAVEASQ